MEGHVTPLARIDLGDFGWLLSWGFELQGLEPTEQCQITDLLAYHTSHIPVSKYWHKRFYFNSVTIISALLKSHHCPYLCFSTMHSKYRFYSSWYWFQIVSWLRESSKDYWIHYNLLFGLNKGIILSMFFYFIFILLDQYCCKPFRNELPLKLWFPFGSFHWQIMNHFPESTFLAGSRSNHYAKQQWLIILAPYKAMLALLASDRGKDC